MAFAALGEGDKATELFSLINPINHARTRAGVQRYKVEPYVVAADVYSVAPHVGRGGWTWYTGSAGWMYRAGIEAILGLRLEGDFLRARPLYSQGLAGLRNDPRRFRSLCPICLAGDARRRPSAVDRLRWRASADDGVRRSSSWASTARWLDCPAPRDCQRQPAIATMAAGERRPKRLGQ